MRLTRRGRAAVVTFGVGVVLGFYGAVQGPLVGLDATGPDGGVALREAELPYVSFTASTPRSELLGQARLLLDGTDVTDKAEVSADGLVFKPERLAAGTHDLVLRIGRGFPFGAVRHRWDFRVQSGASPAGSSGEPATRVPMVVQRVGTGGSTTTRAGALTIAKRDRPSTLRSVHVTHYAWTNPELREPIIDMVESGRINSVQLDLKSESGAMGYDSDIPLANEIESDKGIYDLEQAVETLHSHGAHVVGRIVAFRDPILAEAAWDAGDRAQVLQTPAGEPYAGYGGFTNFAHPVVRRYNIAIAKEAAKAGVDDILYDYVRRPETPRDELKIPELERGCPESDEGECTASDAIVSFLADSREALQPYGVWQGAAVFGIAALRPERVAQDIPRMAQHVDYIAPMVYPSHWGPGVFGVADPPSQPYDIVSASLKSFQASVQGTNADVIPWLQDFSLDVAYGRDEVQAQIRAARETGTAGWFLWSPSVTYTASALAAHK